jgi:hypothetical protein
LPYRALPSFVHLKFLCDDNVQRRGERNLIVPLN